MVTPISMTGLGPQVITAGSLYQLWNFSTGDVSIDSSTLIGGRPSLRINSTTTTGARITKILPGTPGGILVGRRKVRLAQTPDTSQVEALTFSPAVGYSARIGYNGGKFRARWGSGQTGVVSDTSWVVGSVHLIDYRINFGVSPMTIDWSIDGVAQPQAVDAAAQAASTYDSFTLGPPGSDGWVANYGDIEDSATSGDYPLGDSTIISVKPVAASGTATGDANAFEGTLDGGTTYTQVPTGDSNITRWLNHTPMGDPTNYVRQVIAGSGNYLTIPMQDITATSIRAVRAVLCYGTETSGTANNAAASVIMSDTTEVPILGSSTAPVNYSPGTAVTKFADAIIPPPSGGWTVDEVNALTFRLGYSTDVSPQPRWYGVMLEVDVAAGSAGGGGGVFGADTVAPTSQFLRPASITGSSGTWAGAATDLAEVTPDDSTVIVSPANPTAGTYEEIKLTAGTAPGSTSGHIVHYRYRLQGPGPMDLTVELRNGSTVVATWNHPNISSSFVQANQTLTAAQAAACAPYTDLRLRFSPNYTAAPNGPNADLQLTRVDGRTVTADWSGSAPGDAAITSATIAWGDGQNTYTWPTTKTATHAYPATPTGNRNPVVTVTDANGLTSQATAAFNVQSAAPPVLNLTRTRIDENSVTLGIAVTPGANPVSRIDVTSWGDGQTDLGLPASTTSIRHDYPATPTGFKTISVTVTDNAGLTATGTTTFEVQAVSSGGDVIVYAVGDISAAGTKQTDNAVAQMIASAGDMDYFVPLGDLQYPAGLIADFNTYYDASMGQFKSKTFPCPGNHEYDNPGNNAPGYAAYFGASIAYPNGATKYYHHHDVGNWRILCLDSELLTGQNGVTSAEHDAQLTWLDARLAEISGTTKGLVAAWHRPRYCSATTHPSANGTTDLPYIFTSKLVDAKADLILTGHDHVYERFAPMGKTNNTLSTGPIHIVVGTGGCGGTGYTLGSVETGSQVRIGFGSECFGALRLRLGASDWSYAFKRSGGVANNDSGGPISIHAK